MVLNFPNPYPDEIFYSIVSRYYDYYGTSGPKELLSLLFSKGHQSATIDFPNNLKAFSENVWSQYYSPQNIISNHTLIPLYIRFLDAKRQNLLTERQLNIGGNLHATIGVNAGLSKSLRLPRFCRICYEEDLRKLGESYFRRTHQIPYLSYCTQHRCELEQVLTLPRQLNKHQFLSTSSIISHPALINRIAPDKQFEKISSRIIELLCPDKTHIFNLDPYFYRSELQKIGFAKGKHSIDLELLYQSFTDYFPRELLSSFRSEVDFNRASCWLKSIIRKHRKSFDPVRHVLLEDFINNYSGGVINPSSKKNKSWPCLNPACKNFNKSVLQIHSTHLDKKSKREISVIKCHCGFSYTESLLNNNKVFRRVKSYGHIWEKKLAELLVLKKSIRNIATLLNCDSKTILHHLNSREVKSVKTKDSELLLKKRQWSDLKKMNSMQSVTQLRKAQPSLYSYLYRNDKEWLINQEYPKLVRTTKARLNWQCKDEEISALIKSKYHYLLSMANGKRISRSLLLKLTGVEHTYRKNIKNLPRSSRLLAKCEETLLEHRIRRVKLAIKQIENENLSLKRWRIYRIAGIRKEYISEELECMINTIIDQKMIPSLISA